MLHTTFKRLRKAKACKFTYLKLGRLLGGIKNYGDNTPIPLGKIRKLMGNTNTEWVLIYFTKTIIESSEALDKALQSYHDWFWKLGNDTNTWSQNMELKIKRLIHKNWSK